MVGSGCKINKQSQGQHNPRLQALASETAREAKLCRSVRLQQQKQRWFWRQGKLQHGAKLWFVYSILTHSLAFPFTLSLTHTLRLSLSLSVLYTFRVSDKSAQVQAHKCAYVHTRAVTWVGPSLFFPHRCLQSKASNQHRLWRNFQPTDLLTSS